MSVPENDYDLYKTKAAIVYIAGPMGGYEDFNFPLFFAVEDLLVSEGFEVLNPARLDGQEGVWEHTPEEVATATVTTEARAAYLKRDLEYLVTADAIALLPGWQESVGANVELMTSLVCGLEVWEFVETSFGLQLVYSDARPDLFLLMQHVMTLQASAEEANIAVSGS